MFLGSPVWITAKWEGATESVMIEEECSAGTYGPGGQNLHVPWVLMCTRLHGEALGT